MATLEELRAKAALHTRQLESVHWLGVEALAVRWGVSKGTVRKIARQALPYLTFGETMIRRFDPRDVETYEAEMKRGAA